MKKILFVAPYSKSKICKLLEVSCYHPWTKITPMINNIDDAAAITV